jgi:cell wall assembly regulator SMI1
MKEQWEEIKNKLNKLNCIDKVKLNNGASIESITKLEFNLGVTLPEDFKNFLAIHNGQEESAELCLFRSDILLSVQDIHVQWDNWIGLEDMNEEMVDDMLSNPTGCIKPLYTNKKWIPITKDGCGNHIGIDLDPDENGIVGQIITFGTDQDTKNVIAESIIEFIKALKTVEWTTDDDEEWLTIELKDYDV